MKDDGSLDILTGALSSETALEVPGEASVL